MVETQHVLQKKDMSNYATPFTVAIPRPIEEDCECLACRRFSRSYLRHLFLAKEMLGPILASIHNLTFLHRLTSRIRAAIAAGRFVQFRLEVLEALGP